MCLARGLEVCWLVVASAASEASLSMLSTGVLNEGTCDSGMAAGP